MGYYRAKFKKFISSDDHVKRADYLAWERKYWDLKRMLKYLPKDQRALYNEINHRIMCAMKIIDCYNTQLEHE